MQSIETIKFTDLPVETRLAFLRAVDSAGGQVHGYSGLGVTVAVPCIKTTSAGIAAIDKVAGDHELEPYDSQGRTGNQAEFVFFPLGSDKPEARFRHSGSYPESKGFWCFRSYRPRGLDEQRATADGQ